MAEKPMESRWMRLLFTSRRPLPRCLIPFDQWEVIAFRSHVATLIGRITLAVGRLNLSWRQRLDMPVEEAEISPPLGLVLEAAGIVAISVAHVEAVACRRNVVGALPHDAPGVVGSHFLVDHDSLRVLFHAGELQAQRRQTASRKIVAPDV